MKELQLGSMIYHKKFGIGIVQQTDLNEPYIHFEHNYSGFYVPRDQVFTKGDRVLIRKTSNSFGSKCFDHHDVRTFIGYAPHCKKRKYVVSHEVDGGHCTIHSYTYVYDIIHLLHEPSVSETVSGRFRSFEPNFKEVPKSYTMPKNCPYYEELTDKERMDMKNSIARMERRQNLRDLQVGEHIIDQILEEEDAD